jgi:uncharacterized membrane protein YcgQ (UPF0703/DUF1980 family)
MPMAEFVTRAVRDPGRSLAGVRVRLVGFVAPAEDGDKDGRYRLTRFVIFCCAADDPNPQPPVLDADVVRPIAPPRPPYEYSMQFSG